MKFKKIIPKAAAVVMAAVTVFSVLPATTAFAAVGDVGTISFSHTYDGNGNAMRYNSSANINGYIAGGMGNYKYRMFVDGDTAFCLQPGVPLKTGNTRKKHLPKRGTLFREPEKSSWACPALWVSGKPRESVWIRR